MDSLEFKNVLPYQEGYIVVGVDGELQKSIKLYSIVEACQTISNAYQMLQFPKIH